MCTTTLALVCYDETNCPLLILVPESPALFSSSPFKALSPQPPKFLKALLMVREENKAKKVLEARPLLGQEVTGTSPLHPHTVGPWLSFTFCFIFLNCSLYPFMFLNVLNVVPNCIAVFIYIIVISVYFEKTQCQP